MGFGIFHGAYLVTQTRTLGGATKYDVVRVTGGRGTVSEPWKVKSTLNSETYTVSASEIIKESYKDNYSKEDADTIYKSITNIVPVEEPKKPTIDLFDTPF